MCMCVCYKYSLKKSFIFALMCIHLVVTAWNWITFREAQPWRRLIRLFSATINCL